METAFGYIACNACNYMLYAASRRLSLATVTALGKVTEKVTDFVFDAAVSKMCIRDRSITDKITGYTENCLLS